MEFCRRKVDNIFLMCRYGTCDTCRRNQAVALSLSAETDKTQHLGGKIGSYADKGYSEITPHVAMVMLSSGEYPEEHPLFGMLVQVAAGGFEAM